MENGVFGPENVVACTNKLTREFCPGIHSGSVCCSEHFLRIVKFRECPPAFQVCPMLFESNANTRKCQAMRESTDKYERKICLLPAGPTNVLRQYAFTSYIFLSILKCLQRIVNHIQLEMNEIRST